MSFYPSYGIPTQCRKMGDAADTQSDLSLVTIIDNDDSRHQVACDSCGDESESFGRIGINRN